MKKVACYVRVSTENQIENYSIEEQTERLKAYCKAKDWTIHKFYIDGVFRRNHQPSGTERNACGYRQNLIQMVVIQA